MLNIGLFELIFFIAFALIFLGPEKLLELLKTVYRLYQKIKHLMQNFQTDLERELKLNELQQTLESEINKVRDLEKMLSRKIHTDLDTDQPVYLGLPYSYLGNFVAITPLQYRKQMRILPFSYMYFNEQILYQTFTSPMRYS